MGCALSNYSVGKSESQKALLSARVPQPVSQIQPTMGLLFWKQNFIGAHTSIEFYLISDYFHAITADLSSWNRDTVAHKTESVCNLDFHR